MSYLWLVWTGLARNPLRTALTTGSVVIAFTLLWMLKAVDSGIARRIDSIPDDLLYVTGRAFPGLVPLAGLYAMENMPGVSHVAHLRYHNSTYRDFKGGVTLFAVDLERYLQVAYDLRIDPAVVRSFLDTPGAAIAGGSMAERFGWKTGDRVSLRPIGPPLDEWSFEIVGFWEYGSSAAGESDGLIVSYGHVDQSLPEEQAGLVSGFTVRVDDARQAGGVGAAIDDHFANSAAPTLTARMRDVAVSGRHPDQVRLVANAIVGAAFLAILFCTAGVMAQSVRDRYLELAVMKSLGFGTRGLLVGVAGESVAICTVGALVALLPAAMVDAGALLGRRYGAIVYPPGASLYPIGFAAALALAALSVVLPGWRVVRLSPAEVARR